jgi:hypothetical protein
MSLSSVRRAHAHRGGDAFASSYGPPPWAPLPRAALPEDDPTYIGSLAARLRRREAMLHQTQAMLHQTQRFAHARDKYKE